MLMRKNKEIDYLNIICSQIKDEAFSKRVHYYLEWYIKHANRSRRCYYIMNIFVIIFPLILTFFNSYCIDFLNNSYVKFAIIILPLVTSFINSILILFRFLEKWSRYRNTVSISMVFLSKYIDLQQNNNDFEKQKCQLHREFDDIIENEIDDWKRKQQERIES